MFVFLLEMHHQHLMKVKQQICNYLDKYCGHFFQNRFQNFCNCVGGCARFYFLDKTLSVLLYKQKMSNLISKVSSPDERCLWKTFALQEQSNQL